MHYCILPQGMVVFPTQPLYHSSSGEHFYRLFGIVYLSRVVWYRATVCGISGLHD